MRLLTVVVIGLVLNGATPAADPPADPITKPGEQSLFGGRVMVAVADDGMKCRYEVTFAGSAGAVVKRLEAKSAAAKGWFVVAESAGRVWLFRGGDDLFLLEYADNPPGGPAGGTSSTTGLAPGEKKTAAALAKAPKSVVERLPAAFKVPAKGK